jgi:nitrogen-specific signal transduction histidine kinase
LGVIEPYMPFAAAPAAPRPEAQLRHAQKLDAISQIAGGIAHEFNNLLLAVNLNLEAIADEVKASATTQPLFDAAQDAIEQVRDLIRQLLAFSGRQPLEPTNFDINHAVLEARAMLRLVLPADVEVETALDPLAGFAFADRYQFATALLNIALNSGDAMPGGGRLIVSTLLIEADDHRVRSNPDLAVGDYVLIEVGDSGPGMGDAVLRAFEPFFTTRGHAGHSGLGLSQVYGYAKQSGGDVEIDSGRAGTMIRMMLPAGHGATAARHRDEPAPLDTGGETILLVEDAPSVRQAVQRLLRDLGYHVLTAAGPAEAIAFIESDCRIDLLFTDIVLPGALGGDELAIVARQLRPGIRVLYTTGYSELRPPELDDGGPPPGLIPKPYTSADLARRLRAMLDAETAPA